MHSDQTQCADTPNASNLHLHVNFATVPYKDEPALGKISENLVDGLALALSGGHKIGF